VASTGAAACAMARERVLAAAAVNIKALLYSRKSKQTSFVEQHTAELVFMELLSFIAEALQGMSSWESSTDTRKNASQLLDHTHSLLTPQFIVADLGQR